MAQQFYFWEGDLVAGSFDYLDLWAYEEYGNSDAFFETVAVGPVIGSDDADRVEVFDSLERTRVERSRDVADQALLDDLAERAIVRPREQADQLVLPDFLDAHVGRYQEATDQLALPDLLETQIIRQKEIADQIELADFAERIIARQIEASDSVLLGDSLEQAILRLREQADQLALPDVLDVQLERPKEFADLLLLPDSVDIQIIRQREETDRIALQDLLERARILGQIELADGIYVLDAVDPPGAGLDRIEVWILRQQAGADEIILPDTVEELIEQISPPVPVPGVLDRRGGFGVVHAVPTRRRKLTEDEIIELIMAEVI